MERYQVPFSGGQPVRDVPQALRVVSMWDGPKRRGKRTGGGWMESGEENAVERVRRCEYAAGSRAESPRQRSRGTRCRAEEKSAGDAGQVSGHLHTRHDASMIQHACCDGLARFITCITSGMHSVSTRMPSSYRSSAARSGIARLIAQLVRPRALMLGLGCGLRTGRIRPAHALEKLSCASCPDQTIEQRPGQHEAAQPAP